MREERSDELKGRIDGVSSLRGDTFVRDVAAAGFDTNSNVINTTSLATRFARRSTGDGRAVASRGGFCLEGAFLWRLKDKIDREWMAGYKDLPEMEPEEEFVGITEVAKAWPKR